MLTITDLFCGAGGSSSGAEQVPGVTVRMAANHWRLDLLTAPSPASYQRGHWSEMVLMGGTRQAVLEGRVDLMRVGRFANTATPVSTKELR